MSAGRWTLQQRQCVKVKTPPHSPLKFYLLTMETQRCGVRPSEKRMRRSVRGRLTWRRSPSRSRARRRAGTPPPGRKVPSAVEIDLLRKKKNEQLFRRPGSPRGEEGVNSGQQLTHHENCGADLYVISGKKTATADTAGPKDPIRPHSAFFSPLYPPNIYYVVCVVAAVGFRINDLATADTAGYSGWNFLANYYQTFRDKKVRCCRCCRCEISPEPDPRVQKSASSLIIHQPRLFKPVSAPRAPPAEAPGALTPPPRHILPGRISSRPAPRARRRPSPSCQIGVYSDRTPCAPAPPGSSRLLPARRCLLLRPARPAPPSCPISVYRDRTPPRAVGPGYTTLAS